MDEEVSLVAAASAGSLEAFSVLVERYKDTAARIAYSYVGQWEDAKDVSQEAFIKAYRRLKQLRGSFRPWLISILINQCRDHLRSRQRHRREPDDTLFETLPSAGPSPSQAAADAELGRRLTQAIRALPDRQRAAVVLRYVQGESMEDMAQIMGCASGTVKATLWQATQTLRRRLGDALSETEGVSHAGSRTVTPSAV